MFFKKFSLFRASKEPLSPADAFLLTHYRELRENYNSHLTGYMNNDHFLRSPRSLGIETFVKCNAICEFCPYPSSTRIDQRMSTETVQKIIDEVSEAEHPIETIQLARLNEPMLDKRYFDLLDYATRKIPTARHNHSTNGTTLTEKNIERIVGSERVGFMHISLNSHDPEEHHRLMGIDFDLVYRNLKRLHLEYEKLSCSFPVILTRVGNHSIADYEFMTWCAEHFPLFKPAVHPRFDWFGKITQGVDKTKAPRGCRQFYELHFLADGREAFCCIDEEGRHGHGNIHGQHALEIYNQPARLALRQAKSRSANSVCRKCNALL